MCTPLSIRWCIFGLVYEGLVTVMVIFNGRADDDISDNSVLLSLWCYNFATANMFSTMIMVFINKCC